MKHALHVISRPSIVAKARQEWRGATKDGPRYKNGSRWLSWSCEVEGSHRYCPKDFSWGTVLNAALK